jgi:UDP-N-acetylglucosamine--N-acetylmuramyl-(pentapeptide) pyrophosphoryl-undecaprenol N-acetylglucosamine transferase
MSYAFILSGGGTGGHIYPAIAIADALRVGFPGCSILFVGANNKMEMVKVPQAGYAIEGLNITGLDRKLSRRNLLLPFRFWRSVERSRKLLDTFKPNVVIGTGGFASAPLLYAASRRGIPFLLQEQNAHAGLVNKWLAPRAKVVCVAYENMQRYFKNTRIEITGNPVRPTLMNVSASRTEAAKHFRLDPEQKVLLLLGGSLGSARMNSWMAEQLKELTAIGFQVIWQCGPRYFETYEVYESESVRVTSFIERMDLVYALSDGIISRSGAGAVSELSILGKPVLFIPSPNVAEDHQTKNAIALTERSAALLLRETEMNTESESLIQQLVEEINHPTGMGERLKKHARPNAAHEIVELIQEILHER